MTRAEVHEDDIRAYENAREDRDRMRGMAENHYINVVVRQSTYDKVMAEYDGVGKQITYTTSEVKEMLMDVMRVGGLEEEWVRQRAGDDD